MRPFDRTRDGFLLGEGSAFFVLEELSHALGRGARIYAEIAGHGRSCEAYHATDPHPEGLGYARALEKALRHARVNPTEVDYINAHGSATPLNDPIETLAIKRVFKDHARQSGRQRDQAGDGALDGGIRGDRDGDLRADDLAAGNTSDDQSEQAGPGCDLDYVSGEARAYPVRVAVNLSAGFGGRYACLVLRKY